MRGFFSAVNQSYIPPLENLLGGRFVIEINNSGTSEQKYEARYVVQGHLDK